MFKSANFLSYIIQSVILFFFFCICFNYLISSELSTLFHKGDSTFRTPDFDLSFSPRDPDLLPASGASINMVDPSLFHQFQLLFEKAAYLICSRKKCLILRIAFRHIPRKHPVIAVNDQCPSDHIPDHPHRIAG